MKIEKFKVLLYLKKSGMDKNGKASHHGTHHGEQDYGAVLLQVVLHSIALESSCQPIGGQEQGSRGDQQGHRALLLSIQKAFDVLVEKRTDFEAKDVKEAFRAASRHRPPFSPSWTSISVNSAPMRA